MNLMLVEDVNNWRRPSTVSRMEPHVNLDKVRLSKMRFCASLYLDRVCIKLLIANTSVVMAISPTSCSLSYF